MDLFLLIIGMAAVIVFFTYIGKGFFAVSAKRYLIRGAELAKKGEFESARRAVISAARQNPGFKRNADVQALYEIILTKSADGTIHEIDRILSAIPTWKKTKPEVLVESEAFKVAMVIFWIVWILVKFAG
jgi:hypothetical protein